MKTDKELVEFIYDKLMVQGRLSMDAKTVCMYRGPEGTKCAIGHLIPDDKYIPDFESKTIYANNFNDSLSIVGMCLKDLGYTGEQIKLLGWLQAVHDHADNPTFRSDIHMGFVKVCREYKIDAELKGVEHYEMVQ